MPADVNPMEPTASAPDRRAFMAPKRIDLGHRLLAETVRVYEDAQGFAIDDPQTDAIAREAGGDLEHRIIVRAQSLGIAPALENALHQLRSVSSLVIAIGMGMAAIAGATTARVALGTQVDEPLNFFWVLGSILGVQTIALLMWLVSMFIKPSAVATGSLGGAIFALARRANQWLHKGPAHLAAAQAAGSVFVRSSIGRWTLSALSHALWLSFITGCLLLVVLMLSTKQYSFAWETTILSDRTYIALTRALAFAPEALGFPTPDPEQIAASRWTGAGAPPPESREAWSGLLIGSIVAYGFLPRLVLLLLCLIVRQRASARFRLDTTLPGYARLQTRLMPVSKTIGVVDADKAPEAGWPTEARDEGQPLPIRAEGPIAIMGLEIDPPKSTWPPPLKGVDWLDLGMVDSRSERQRALEQITSALTPPRLIMVVCSVATTPDRGTRAFINELQQSSRTPVAIVLTEGQRLRARGHGDQVSQRIEDWRQLAKAAQVPKDRVAEIDLDHLTDASRANLAALIGVKEAGTSPGRRIEQAFTLILDHVERWSGEPSTSEQAELHRAIATLYRNERPSWQTLLRVNLKEGGNKVEQLKSNAEQLKTSAERVMELLPNRLRNSPKWLAAGATAGAMGCVAAATLIAPAAIAALPAWAGLGAALSLAIQPATSDRSAAASPPARIDLSQAVSSAALFAILLELQGRSEATITRIIDQVADDDPPPIDSARAAREWLDTLRHRLDLALAPEGRS
jgi:hypothetical protein